LVVGEGVGLGVGEGVGLGVGEAVGLGVGLGVGEGVREGVGLGVGEGVGLGVGEAVGLGVAVAAIAEFVSASSKGYDKIPQTMHNARPTALTVVPVYIFSNHHHWTSRLCLCQK
jgi:hypothetical protein